MTTPDATADDDLGVVYFEDFINQTPSQKKGAAAEDRNILTKVADTGLLGPLVAGEEMRRQTGRTAARFGEALAGLPGDVRELFNSMAVGIPEYLSGEELPGFRKVMEGITGGMVQPPTSSQIREGVTKELTGEALEPQNKWEEFGDTVAEDFASLLIPVKGKIPFARALGTSVMANSGAEIANAFGGDKAKAATKLGLLFAGGMLGHGQGSVKQHIQGLYSDMRESVPKNAEVSSKGLSSRLAKIEATLRKGDPSDASKQPAFQKIQAIREKMASGMIPVEEVVALNKSTNEAIFGLGELKRGQNQLYDIRDALHESVGQYGKENAEFLGKWKNANEAYAATKMSQDVGNFVRRNVKPRDYLHAVGALGLGGGFVGAPVAGATIAGAGGVAATAYTAEVLKRIAQSPALATYYKNIVTNSLNQNKASFTKAMGQLDKGLKESFEKEPFETFVIED